jgi:hypothetical protein
MLTTINQNSKQGEEDEEEEKKPKNKKPNIGEGPCLTPISYK